MTARTKGYYSMMRTIDSRNSTRIGLNCWTMKNRNWTNNQSCKMNWSYCLNLRIRPLRHRHTTGLGGYPTISVYVTFYADHFPGFNRLTAIQEYGQN